MNKPSTGRSFYPALHGALLLLVTLALFGPGLGEAGMWDPQETTVADSALGSHGGSLQSLAVGWSLRALGVSALAGRVPTFLGALVTLLLVFLWVRRSVDRSGALLSALVLMSMPMWVLQGRHLWGAGLSMALQVAMAWMLFASQRHDDSAVNRRSWAVVLGWWLGGWTAGALSLWCSGALLGPLPVAVAVWLTGLGTRTHRGGGWKPTAAALSALLTALTTVLLLFLVTRSVLLDREGYGHWVGGSPTGGEPPTFEMPLELVFHGTAPWVVLLPAALLTVLGAGRKKEEETGADTAHTGGMGTEGQRRTGARWLATFALLWLGGAFVATVIHSARYGQTPMLFAVPVALLVALWLREHRGAGEGLSAVVAIMLAGLVVRDFVLYPASALGALGDGVPELPQSFAPGRKWLVLMGTFMVALWLGLTDGAARWTPAHLWRLVRERWVTGDYTARVWLGLIAVALGAVTLSGGLGLALAGPLGMSAAARRAFVVLLALPLACVVAVLFHWGLRGLWSWLGPYRLWPALAVGVVFGLYTAHGYALATSVHLSPKRVYLAHQRYSAPGAPIHTLDMPRGHARYFTDRTTVTARDRKDLVSVLLAPRPAWAVIPEEHLSWLDHDVRKRTGRHLFAVPTGSAVLHLVSNRNTGFQDINPLARTVLSTPTTPTVQVNANFDGRVVLRGYDLDGADKGVVARGHDFRITWHWHVTKPLGADYRVFLHVDGSGGRINGDHDPVGGSYPTRYWETGDYILDSHTLEAGRQLRGGTYKLFVGFFSGNRRLTVVDGPKDGGNRVLAGKITIR